MSHRNLTRYIEDRINSWNRLITREEMTFPLTMDDVREIVSVLECDLSPENLHCDGEITRAQANRKYKFYMKVYDELYKEMGNIPELEY